MESIPEVDLLCITCRNNVAMVAWDELVHTSVYSVKNKQFIKQHQRRRCTCLSLLPVGRENHLQ